MKVLAFAFWLLLGALTCQAATLKPHTDQVNLIDSAQFLEDPSGQLSLEEVRAQPSRFQKWTAGGTQMNFGFTSSAYWIRVPLARDERARADWLLELHFPKYSQIDFYPPQGPAISTGSSYPLDTRAYYDQNFVFPVQVSTHPDYFYLRLTSASALTVPMTLWRPDAFRQQQQRFQGLQFLYFGGILVLTFYGLVIFFSLGDRRFLVFAAYLMAAGMGMFAANGFGRQLVWPEWVRFDEVASGFFFSLAIFFVVFFTAKLLGSPGQRSWVIRSMQWSGYLALPTAALTLYAAVEPYVLFVANQLLMVNGVLSGSLVSLASVLAFRQKRQGVRFFLAGWLVLWVGVLVGSLRAYGWVPSNGITSYAVQLATSVEMVLLAMALGDLLLMEHRAYVASQRQSLVAQEALLKMTQASEDELKQAVKDRTQQLEAALSLEKNHREQYVRLGSMISHEFRTPLGVIQSQASLMRMEHERGLDQVYRRLDAISSAARRLVVMFDKWLHSDAITQSLDLVAPQPLPVEPWLRALIQNNQHLLLNHDIQLQLSSDIGEVVADDYLLGVAVTNLIDNAAKYSPPDTTITLGVCRKEGFVAVSVADHGPGIAPELQDQVFKEFLRLSPHSPIRGVGLGLSIVQRIAQAHGGHVSLSSAPGRGSEFFIWLPDNHGQYKG